MMDGATTKTIKDRVENEPGKSTDKRMLENDDGTSAKDNTVGK